MFFIFLSFPTFFIFVRVAGRLTHAIYISISLSLSNLDMIASKEGEATKQSQESSECCMCGDHGLSFELFRCKICQFRSQHRYCSNQYPKAESYGVCNWCLSQKDGSVVDKTQNSSNSSSSCKNSVGGARDHDHDHANIQNYKKKSNNHHGGLKDRRVNLKIQMNGPIKKHVKSPEQSPATAARKRIMTSGGGVVEERKSKVEKTSNGGGGITKQVFRNKVRRYKLLDEVSSQ